MTRLLKELKLQVSAVFEEASYQSALPFKRIKSGTTLRFVA
jgi:hypothetical protein